MLAPLLSIMLLVLAGCATYGDESIADRPADWPPLTMTKAKLIAQLGEPRMRTLSEEAGRIRETLTWSYAEAQASPALMIPVVGLFVAASGNGISGDSRSLHAVFGQDGKMLSRTWAQGRIGNSGSVSAPEPTATAERPSSGRYDPSSAGSQ